MVAGLADRGAGSVEPSVRVSQVLQVAAGKKYVLTALSRMTQARPIAMCADFL
jgi:hypothetical protein